VARFASVYPLVTARAVARAFTYEVPDEAEKGAVVEVKFGNARRRGVVTEMDVVPPAGVAAAAVERVAETLPARQPTTPGRTAIIRGIRSVSISCRAHRASRRFGT